MAKEIFLNIFKPAIFLAGFAFIGVLVLSVINAETRDKIVENERQALLKQLNEVVDKSLYNNDLLQDQFILDGAPFNSSTPVTVYLAKNNQNLVAALFVATTNKGYSGAIKIVVGIKADQTVSGVRVVSHKETPGLGDGIEIGKSNWVIGFDNKSLGRPDYAKWAVKKDGGEFDQFTGATITPRAIVFAVRDILSWSNKNFLNLFNYQKQATENSGTKE